MVLLSCLLGMTILLRSDLYPESIRMLQSLLVHFLELIYISFVCVQCVRKWGVCM